MKQLVALASLASTMAFGQSANDACRGLLADGMFAHFAQSNSFRSVASSKRDYCSRFSSLKDSGHTIGLQAFIGTFGPLGANYDERQRDNVSQAFCDNSSTFEALESASKILATWGDKTIVEGFNKCEILRKMKLYYNVHPLGDDDIPRGLIITATFFGTDPENVKKFDLIPGGRTGARGQGMAEPQGMECHGDLAGPTTLFTREKQLTCTRPLYERGSHRSGQMDIAADSMDVSIPTDEGEIYARLPSIPYLDGPIAPNEGVRRLQFMCTAITAYYNLVSLGKADNQQIGDDYWQNSTARQSIIALHPEEDLDEPLKELIKHLTGSGDGTAGYNGRVGDLLTQVDQIRLRAHDRLLKLGVDDTDFCKIPHR